MRLEPEDSAESGSPRVFVQCRLAVGGESHDEPVALRSRARAHGLGSAVRAVGSGR
jgi:hypothetical protein